MLEEHPSTPLRVKRVAFMPSEDEASYRANLASLRACPEELEGINCDEALYNCKVVAALVE